jgi:hypothetical protein
VKILTSFIKIALWVPRTLHSTIASVWLDLAIGSKTDMRRVLIIKYVKQVQYAEPQEDHILLASLSPVTVQLQI